MRLHYVTLLQSLESCIENLAVRAVMRKATANFLYGSDGLILLFEVHIF